jgi:hypothetical protein
MSVKHETSDLLVCDNGPSDNYHNSGHYPSSYIYLKPDVSDTGLHLRLKVEPTELAPVGVAGVRKQSLVLSTGPS